VSQPQTPEKPESVSQEQQYVPIVYFYHDISHDPCKLYFDSAWYQNENRVQLLSERGLVFTSSQRIGYEDIAKSVLQVVAQPDRGRSAVLRWDSAPTPAAQEIKTTPAPVVNVPAPIVSADDVARLRAEAAQASATVNTLTDDMARLRAEARNVATTQTEAVIKAQALARQAEIARLQTAEAARLQLLRAEIAVRAQKQNRGPVRSKSYKYIHTMEM
jgi:hypothetical protein